MAHEQPFTAKFKYKVVLHYRNIEYSGGGLRIEVAHAWSHNTPMRLQRNSLDPAVYQPVPQLVQSVERILTACCVRA